MPTGFTAALYDGDQEFKDFVRRAARGMMAFAHLRDESMDAPLTYPKNDAPRRLEGLKDSIGKRINWADATEEEKYAQWSEYVERSEVERNHSEFYARLARFNDMTFKVANFEVPEELESFKDFMLQQLGTEFQYSREPFRPTIMSYPEWCEHQDEWLQRREDNDRKYYREAVERHKEVCHYIDLLAETFGFEVEKNV
jgi:hypothetical protein